MRTIARPRIFTTNNCCRGPNASTAADPILVSESPERSAVDLLFDSHLPKTQVRILAIHHFQSGTSNFDLNKRTSSIGCGARRFHKQNIYRATFKMDLRQLQIESVKNSA